MFDDAVRAVDDSARKLSAGMAVNALAGMIFGCHGYSSLDRVMQNFQVSPLDRLFGIWVKRTTLSDTNIGMQFDNISRWNLDELSWRCHSSSIPTRNTATSSSSWMVRTSPSTVMVTTCPVATTARCRCTVVTRKTDTPTGCRRTSSP